MIWKYKFKNIACELDIVHIFFVYMKTTCYARGSKKAIAMYEKSSHDIIIMQSCQLHQNYKKEELSMNDNVNSLSHSKWNCKYHIVFAPKYRRRAIYGQIKQDIGKIIRQLCDFKEVKIIQGEMCPDHVHILVEIPPKMSIASFMGYLKGKSTLRIFDKYANLKYKYGRRQFWCEGYYVDTVGKNEKIIKEYIKNQLQEDIAYDQISIKEYIDPFTGEKVKK